LKNSLDDSSLDYVPQQVVGYFLLNKKSFGRDHDDELRVNMKQVVSSERWKVIGIYFYLSLPVLIFFLGWMRTYYGIPAAGIVVWMLYRSSRCERKLWQPGWNIDTIRSMCLIALIIALWVYFSGIGGMVYQNPDHIMRNGVFQILVNHKWPVVHTINTVRGILAACGSGWKVFWTDCGISLSDGLGIYWNCHLLLSDLRAISETICVAVAWIYVFQRIGYHWEGVG